MHGVAVCDRICVSIEDSEVDSADCCVVGFYFGIRVDSADFGHSTDVFPTSDHVLFIAQEFNNFFSGTVTAKDEIILDMETSVAYKVCVAGCQVTTF